MILSELFALNLQKLIEFHDQGNQSAAARRCKMKQRTLNRIASGESGCTLSSLEEVAAGYGLKPWQLLFEDFKPERPPEIFQMGTVEAELYAKLEALRDEFDQLKR